MDGNRLEQLKRQKQLLQEHLDWINQEIDRENIARTPSPSPKASRLAEAFADDRPVQSALADGDVENAPSDLVASDLYSELGPDTLSARSETKRGCLLIGGFAFCILGALFSYIFFFY